MTPQPCKTICLHPLTIIRVMSLKQCKLINICTCTSFWILPGPVLKKLVMGNIKSESVTELRVAQSMEFIIERVQIHFCHYEAWLRV